MSEFGRVLGSNKAFASSVKKGGGGNNQWIVRLKDDPLVVRFMTEPEEFVEYREVFDESLGEKGHYRALATDESGDEYEKVTTRYLVNALDVDDLRVIPLMLPKSVASAVSARVEKHGTITDRDYEISRTGTGLNTEYFLTPEDKTKRDMRQYTDDLHDLLKVLAETNEDHVVVAATEEVEIEKDEVEPEEPADDGEFKAEAESDDDDDGEEELDEAGLKALSLGNLRAIATQLSVDHAGLKKAELVEAILATA